MGMRAGRGPARPHLVCVVLLVAALALTGCSGSAQRSSPKGSSTSASAPGPAARIVSTQQVGGRARDLTIDSSAAGTVKVRVLLPTRYQSHPARRWPVLYLLHGCCDSYLSWTRSTDVERFTRNLDALVVMPDGGKAGFYSDWRTGPRWEAFHTVELPHLLATTYRASDRRGVSMGGLGALNYAARHPGMFTVAASFSGIVDTRLSSDESQNYLGLVQSQGEDPLALWGDPDTDAVIWRQHNPYDLATRLKDVQLFVSAGNGHPGPLDTNGAGTDSVELSIGRENEAFAKRLRVLGVPAMIDLYGAGTHNWVYWQRELHRAWPLITKGLGVT